MDLVCEWAERVFYFQNHFRLTSMIFERFFWKVIFRRRNSPIKYLNWNRSEKMNKLFVNDPSKNVQERFVRNSPSFMCNSQVIKGIVRERLGNLCEQTIHMKNFLHINEPHINWVVREQFVRLWTNWVLSMEEVLFERETSSIHSTNFWNVREWFSWKRIIHERDSYITNKRLIWKIIVMNLNSLLQWKEAFFFRKKIFSINF